MSNKGGGGGIEDQSVFVIIEYCGRMRGENVMLLPLKGILAF